MNLFSKRKLKTIKIIISTVLDIKIKSLLDQFKAVADRISSNFYKCVKLVYQTYRSFESIKETTPNRSGYMKNETSSLQL